MSAQKKSAHSTGNESRSKRSEPDALPLQREDAVQQNNQEVSLVFRGGSAASPPPLPPKTVLQLQRLIGNQAVTKLLNERNSHSKADMFKNKHELTSVFAALRITHDKNAQPIIKETEETSENQIHREEADMESVARPPKLKERCRCKEFTIPKGFSTFVSQVQDWVSTCVLSRTEKSDGEPYKREDELVINNPSLYEVWERVHHLTGKNIKVFAKYQWLQTNKGGWMVDSIRFHVSEYENIELLQPPSTNLDFTSDEGSFVNARDQEDATKDAVRIARQALIRNVPNAFGQIWSSRMLYVLKGLEWNSSIDDAYIPVDKLKDALAYRVRERPASRADLEKMDMLRYLRTTLYSLERSTDKDIVNQLWMLDEQIMLGLSVIEGFGNLDRAASGGQKFLTKWISNQQQNRSSIYYYYTHNR